MALDRMGAASLLLFFLLQIRHAASSSALPDQPYPDTWLTGFEPNLIDGQPVEPTCKLIPFSAATQAPPGVTPTPLTRTPTPPTLTSTPPRAPPTIHPAPSTPAHTVLTPKPTSLPRLTTDKKAPPPKPTATLSVASGWPPPVGPFKPRGRYVLAQFFLANGRVGWYGYGTGHGPFPPSIPLAGNRLPTARAWPRTRNRNIPAAGAFQNYVRAPANQPPRRARIPAAFLPAARVASLPRGGLPRRTAALRSHTSTSSDSSEEYRG